MSVNIHRFGYVYKNTFLASSAEISFGIAFRKLFARHIYPFAADTAAEIRKVDSGFICTAHVIFYVASVRIIGRIRTAARGKRKYATKCQKNAISFFIINLRSLLFIIFKIGNAPISIPCFYVISSTSLQLKHIHVLLRLKTYIFLS